MAAVTGLDPETLLAMVAGDVRVPDPGPEPTRNVMEFPFEDLVLAVRIEGSHRLVIMTDDCCTYTAELVGAGAWHAHTYTPARPCVFHGPEPEGRMGSAAELFTRSPYYLDRIAYDEAALLREWQEILSWTEQGEDRPLEVALAGRLAAGLTDPALREIVQTLAVAWTGTAAELIEASRRLTA